MVRIAILVEGQTEEKFVNEVLCPYFGYTDFAITPVIVSTKVTKNGTKYKGGLPKYNEIKKQVQNLLHNHDYVTTMFDYYGLPQNFAGKEESNSKNNLYDKIATIEESFYEDIDKSNFIPYIAVHEFEALLFSNTIGVQSVFSNFSEFNLNEFEKIVNEFSNPEEINNNPNTAPSKRLEQCTQKYNKILHGTRIAKEIGVSAMRAKCPHFNKWVAQILNLNYDSNPF